MTKGKHIHLGSSVFVTGLILPSLWFLSPRDFILQVLGFVALQMAMGLASALLILLRITTLLKNKNTWVYYFSGTFQVFLLITDLILLVTNHLVKKNGIITFVSFNTLFAAVILCDIYHSRSSKGNDVEKRPLRSDTEQTESRLSLPYSEIEYMSPKQPGKRIHDLE